MNSRIDAIKNFAAARDNAEERKRQEEIRKQNDLIDQVKALKPRITELISVGNACLANGIEIDKYHNSWNCLRVNDDYEHGTFVSNGISHHVGFLVYGTGNSRYISYVGRYNGGFCGVYDFRTNGDRVEFVNEKQHLTGNDIRKPDIKNLTTFLAEFDKFETKFYEYIDNLAATH